MSKISDGGPAFPRAGNEWDDMAWVEAPAEKGMTLRDYFAAKSIPLATRRLERNWQQDIGDDWCWDVDDYEEIAQVAYNMADAMLKVRKA